MTPQPGKETIAIHISPNIVRSKGNQTIKFGHLIEYSMRNIFLEKSYAKCGGETIPRSFLKKSKLRISLGECTKVSCNLVLLYKPRAIKKYWNKTADHLILPKSLLKKNKRSGTSILASFSAWFLKKNISIFIFSWPSSIVWIPLLCEILDNMFVVIVS